MGGDVTFQKEMGITRAEIFRVIARALDGRKHLRNPDGVVVGDNPPTKK